MSNNQSPSKSSPSSGYTVAIVSGKGGSGKTMLAVAIAQGLSLNNKRVTLIDTDFGTGGLSYYLTFRTFTRARVGIADVLHESARAEELADWAAFGRVESIDDDWLDNVRLVPVGDQRQIGEEITEKLSLTIASTLTAAKQISDAVIVDCRGGIDRQSLEVCDKCDNILVIIETDPTSIQASQHLVEVLSRRGLAPRIMGFVINKVMDNPTDQAKIGSSLLRSEYLGAVPFDIDATRAYIQGKVPAAGSLFSRHVFYIVSKVFPDAYRFESIRTLSPEEYGTVTLKAPEGRFGSIAVVFLSIYASISTALTLYDGRPLKASEVSLTFTNLIWILLAFNVLVFLALTERFKQYIGSIFAYSNRVMDRFYIKLRRKAR